MDDVPAYPITIRVSPEGESVLMEVVRHDTGEVVFKMLFPPSTMYQMAQSFTVSAMKAEGKWSSE